MRKPSALVISPHLDDAVFSCGELMAALPGALVITALAGLPPVAMSAPPWDATAGFASARQAVLARREEDRIGLAMLEAQPLWLDYLDGQYGTSPSQAALAEALSAVLLTLTDSLVLAPAGLHHSDHGIVHAACAVVWERDSARPWFFYEDAIHRRTPGALDRQLATWNDAGIVATLAAPSGLRSLPVTKLRKARAVAAYASQYPLFGGEQLADLTAPERYWQWERRHWATARASVTTACA
ncbi:PIG-L deacetylase family protein [Cupriavidus basilensis]|uniref:PIG-L family deacetylase n=1 Tax=Cupriavidus basilensis TaxID=68895 RepID=A0A643G017_9BURK|nr:PIG-L family deacetylase [Cupriavidus basilensis]QOT81907.1 PIG-L family deacetylase [Cupriavidus basilensis]